MWYMQNCTCEVFSRLANKFRNFLIFYTCSVQEYISPVCRQHIVKKLLLHNFWQNVIKFHQRPRGLIFQPTNIYFVSYLCIIHTIHITTRQGSGQWPPPLEMFPNPKWQLVSSSTQYKNAATFKSSNTRKLKSCCCIAASE